MSPEIVQRAKCEVINWLRGTPSDYFQKEFPGARYNYMKSPYSASYNCFCAGAMLGAVINRLATYDFHSAEEVGKEVYGDNEIFFDFISKGVSVKCPREAADYLESLVELPEYRVKTEEDKLRELADELGYELVKKTTPDTFASWGTLGPRFNYIARDQDGLVFAHEKEPKLEDSCWLSVNMSSRIDHLFTGHVPGTCDWTESLIKRT